ncbi:MAG: PRTRC system protein E [Chitinophagaceae bacterium]
MKTNFFQLLMQMAPNLDWNIRITKIEDNLIKVCVLPFNDQLKDSAKNVIQPMIINGSPDELNDQFFQTIQTPVTQVAALFANMDAFAKSLEETRKRSLMEKEARDKEEKDKKDKKTKYEAMMKKVADLEKDEKWGEAIGTMPSLKEFAAWADEINNKLIELRSKHNTLSLFNS